MSASRWPPLVKRYPQDAVLGERFKAAGVDDQIRLAAASAVVRSRRSRPPWLRIGHQRITYLGQAAGEVDFADTWASDEDEGGREHDSALA